MEGVGLTAVENTTGMPLVMPPLMPPLWLVRVTSRPFSMPSIASLARLPKTSRKAEAQAELHTLTAGTL